MRRNICMKLLVAVMAIVMLVSVLPMGALAAEGKVMVLNVNELETFGKETKDVGDTTVAGDFIIHWGSPNNQVNDKKDTKFEDIEVLKRINFSSKTSIKEDEIKNAIEFTVDAPASVKIWWVHAGKPAEKEGDYRNVAVFNADGTVKVQSNEQADKDARLCSTLDVDAAGTYYIGSLVNHNYIVRVEGTVEATEEEHPGDSAIPRATDKPGENENPGENEPTTPPAEENPPAGDNSGILLLMGLMVISMGAVLVIGKKAIA